MIDYYNPNFLYSTVFGLGKLLKKGAGTLGSIVAFPLIVLLFKLSHLIIETFSSNPSTVYDATIIVLLFIAAMGFIGVYTSTKYEKITKKNDPGEVIMDEVVGQSLVIVATLPFTYGFIIAAGPLTHTLNIIEVTVISALASFLLFRIFDIAKPWPINWIDKNLHGGWGIMLDDVCAALLAIVIYYFILFFVVIDHMLR